MNRYGWVLVVAALGATTSQANWLFPKGVGKYGPYTGGHGYSYATAYHYGFAWSAADTWNRDIFNFPSGYSPYRPYGKPISKTVFPHPETPYIAVPGPDGLYRLVKPGLPPLMDEPVPGVLAPIQSPHLQPVPVEAQATAQAPALLPAPTTSATIKIHVPPAAEVWIEKEKLQQTGSDRVTQTAPLAPGKMHIIAVRAKWKENGRDFDQIRVVGVRAGETAKVTFDSNIQP